MYMDYKKFDIWMQHRPDVRWNASVEVRSAILGVIPTGRQMFGAGGMKIMGVDGEMVRDHIDVDFALGGNPARYGYVPLREIWIEQGLRPRDKAAVLLHELVEYEGMRIGLKYDRAHDQASDAESMFRSSRVKVAHDQDVVESVVAFWEGK